ncbi:MAG: hypothetical protein OIF32_11460, partial [Campylobacterales bacterium]|nr:hypothetical protein [Campylobacterales bacterium]
GRISLEIGQLARGISVTGKLVANPVKENKNRSTPLAKESKAFHKESLGVIAKFNERKCMGLPLYGEDLLSALTVVTSIKPSRTRFCGMGYVNCLNATTSTNSRKSWKEIQNEMRYKTNALTDLVSFSQRYLDTQLGIFMQKSLQQLK